MTPTRTSTIRLVKQRMTSEKRRFKRYYWSEYSVEIAQFLLQAAGIKPGDRVCIQVAEPGMLVVLKL